MNVASRRIVFASALLWTWPLAAQVPGKTEPASAAKTEPTNAAEAAAKKSAEDAATEAKYRTLTAELSPERQAWERTLEQNLGNFYLPLHKRAFVAGRSTCWDFVPDAPGLPRALLIGDSVSGGYTLAARKALAGKANLHKAPENCGPTANGLKKLDVWLGTGPWDVIHFNFGIHDRNTPLDVYEQRLEEIVARLQKTKAKLIWASTTPIPTDEAKKQTADSIVQRNAVAARVMEKHGIAVDDLFAFITPHLEKAQNPNDVHFNGGGYEMLGKQVAASILAVLPAQAPAAAPEAQAERPFGDRVRLRGNLDRSRRVFETTKKGTVAFIGGSITEMNGYRPLVCELLKKRFPDTEFEFVAAGIASTCSTTGAFRLETDVLAGRKVDLFFIEFAVNDDQDAFHTRAECIRGLEGIVRQARRNNPAMDLVVTYFVNEGMLKTLDAGQVPLTCEAHEAVCKHYGISSSDLAAEIAGRLRAGTLTWKEYGGVHPAPRGNGIAADMIGEIFARAWAAPLASAEPALPPLPEPLDPFHYGRGRFVDLTAAKVVSGWTIGVPDWKSLPGGKRERFTALPILSATEAGAELTLEFEGTAVGAFVLAGPDAGIVDARIDDGKFVPVDLFHPFSKGLHYPRTVLFGAELKPGKHTLTLRVSPETRSAGHAVRIIRFAAN